MLSSALKTDGLKSLEGQYILDIRHNISLHSVAKQQSVWMA